MSIVYHPRVWSIDFHVHTSFSDDCGTSPATVIELARKRNLDGIAVTDHETEEGGLATLEANRYSDFLVIPGAEIKTDRGDIIGMFLTHTIRSRRFDRVLEEIADQGGVSVVPHPLRTFRTMEDFISIRRQFPMVDAWEIMNGRYDSRLLRESLQVFQRLSIPNASSGSDAHLPWEIGRCRTFLWGRPSTASEFRRLIQNAFSTAVARSDLAVAFGIHVAGMVCDAKKRKYLSLMSQIISLPHRAVRKATRSLFSPQARDESSFRA
jgi:predicted metal-dependent phosphoesterase TrpH